MKKRYFKFTDTNDANVAPGILAGTHGVERMAEEMRKVGYSVEEVTAKQAARIRQQQNREERLKMRIEQEMEDA